jgi:hypothetical protein
MDGLTGVYDRALEARYGQTYYAGRPSLRRMNTYEFVCRQQDLLQAYMEAHAQGGGGQQLLYGLAAAMRARFEGISRSRPAENHPVTVDTPRFALEEMMRAALAAQREGRTFSGCGASLGPEGTVGAQDELSEAGLGNKTSESTKYTFDKHMHCVVCQAPPKKGENKKMCGPCGICKTCDRKLQK